MRAQSLMQGFESRTSLFPSAQEKQAPDKWPEKDLFLWAGSIWCCITWIYALRGLARHRHVSWSLPPSTNQPVVVTSQTRCHHQTAAEAEETVRKKGSLLSGSWKMLLWPGPLPFPPSLHPYSLLWLLLLWTLRQKELSRRLSLYVPNTLPPPLLPAWPLPL